jgi:hypothetical protein
MEPEAQPKILANKVIRQLVQHMVSDKIDPSWEDYAAIRVVFRDCGGSWDQLIQGDIGTLKLLQTIVGAWGQMPKRMLQMQRVI